MRPSPRRPIVRGHDVTSICIRPVNYPNVVITWEARRAILDKLKELASKYKQTTGINTDPRDTSGFLSGTVIILVDNNDCKKWIKFTVKEYDWSQTISFAITTEEDPNYPLTEAYTLFGPDITMPYEEVIGYIEEFDTENWRLIRDYRDRSAGNRRKFLIIADNLREVVKYKKDYNFRCGFHYRGGLIRYIRTEDDRFTEPQQRQEADINFMERLQRAMEQHSDDNGDQNME